jgi:hypothetical protein
MRERIPKSSEEYSADLEDILYDVDTYSGNPDEISPFKFKWCNNELRPINLVDNLSLEVTEELKLQIFVVLLSIFPLILLVSEMVDKTLVLLVDVEVLVHRA